MAVLTLVLLVPGAGWAEESAADIFRQSRERGALNLVGLTAQLRLTTRARDGAQREQVLSASARRVEGRGRSMTRFLSPPGVAGVTVLTVQGLPGEGDEISIYLPKLRRVRKVARSQRGDAFMQTDFSYADLGTAGGVDEGALARGPDQKLDGRDVFVVTGKPGPESPYGEITAYVDKQTYAPVKVEYSDRSGRPWKVYRAVKLKRFKDRTIAAEAVMENMQSGSRTTLEVLRLEESSLGDDSFTERALERG